MKVTWLDREIVRSPYYLALCKTPGEFEVALRHLKVPKVDWPDFLGSSHAQATVHYFEQTKSGKQTAIVCMDKRRGRLRVEIDGLLIHEAVHIWQSIRESMGERTPSREFEAYSIQALSQNLIHAYWAK